MHPLTCVKAPALELDNLRIPREAGQLYGLILFTYLGQQTERARRSCAQRVPRNQFQQR